MGVRLRSDTVEIPLLLSFLYLLGFTKNRNERCIFVALRRIEIYSVHSHQGQHQVGSSAGAVHLSNGNAGVLR